MFSSLIEKRISYLLFTTQSKREFLKIKSISTKIHVRVLFTRKTKAQFSVEIK